jgi:putative salt-induced outer membrane protein YdiY
VLTDKIITDQFSGSVEFGFTYEQGNQVTKARQGRLTLEYDETDKYKINSKLHFKFENEGGETSTEKYRL